MPSIHGARWRSPAPSILRRRAVDLAGHPQGTQLHPCHDPDHDGALGFKVSLKKGLRSTQVQWVGVRFTLNEDAIILGLPEQFVKELTDLLKAWENKGMAPLRDLRQAAGKLSWLSGILPRARWTVSVFYKVLHDRLNDINCHGQGGPAPRKS